MPELKQSFLLALIFLLVITTSTAKPINNEQNMDKYQPKSYVELTHPEWVKNATIYEVNIRQYTKEGTFNAFSEHLPRLKNLGVDILWLMPIHPIGEKNRKGEKGSYYSVKNYKGINPDFGDMDDLKALVNKAHSMGMYVILDWVANHSAWDNPLTVSNPNWYTTDHNGNFQSTPWWDWSDIIDFDYNNPAMREYMTGALKYWVEEANIDGYRADVAGFIPTDFWDTMRAELDQIKPVFMLEEWDARDLHKNGFDMSYAWELHDVMHDVAVGKSLAMPFIYSGQEAGLDQVLAFFDKDQINWQQHPSGELYKTLFRLKHDNKALWNGNWGGKMIPVPNNQPKTVFSFVRQKDDDKVFVVLNFSDKKQTVCFNENIQHGIYTELSSQEPQTITKSSTLVLEPYSYKVFVK